MATVIHHGGGVGTYKSFSVIQRHAIPQLQQGRYVVSTIRGFDSIRVIEAILDIDIPESSHIEYVDIDTVEGKEKIRRWWEWAPKGAYIIIDEAQLIYPKGLKLTEYDYPARDGMTSQQTAELDDRPNGFIQAFTMQRHYNWDLAIITPNIRMLLPEMREVAQIAYEHRRLGDLIPWRKHGWREIQHLPMETAKQSVHPPKTYNADKRIYKIYKSTKTGAHTNSGAEQSIFKNPKVVGSLSIAFIGIVTFIYILSTAIFGEGGTLDLDKNKRQIGEISDIANLNNVSNSNSDSVPRVSRDIETKTERRETTKLESELMSVVGQIDNEYIIAVGKPENEVQFTTSYLRMSGFTVTIKNQCMILLKNQNVEYVVRCPLHRRYFEPQNDKYEVQVQPFAALTSSQDA
jgi:zona occludens toxin (predicted ATPase)